jgi:hypothetical protein
MKIPNSPRCLGSTRQKRAETLVNWRECEGLFVAVQHKKRPLPHVFAILLVIRYTGGNGGLLGHEKTEQ